MKRLNKHPKFIQSTTSSKKNPFDNVNTLIKQEDFPLSKLYHFCILNFCVR